jgi:hypothetical protein
MRKYLGLAIAAMAGLALLTAARPASQTITGRVIDLYCYSRDKTATGMDHRDGHICALSCVKWEGQPVALLTPDGKVYQLAGAIVAGNNAKVWPHLTHTVSVTGDVADRDGVMTITASDLTMISK